jgi:nitroreductase
MTGSELADMAAALIHSRRTTLPKRLGPPGPDDSQLERILGAASAAPDHGRVLPWRFVLVPQGSRAQLAHAFAAALLERDAAATDSEVARAREKAYRAPLLMLLLVDAGRGDPDIDLHERIVSAGCAAQNMLLMATALGFGSALTSGKALKAAGLRKLFGLSEREHALCFINIGTANPRKDLHQRPSPSDYMSTLEPQGLGTPFTGDILRVDSNPPGRKIA